MRIAFFSPLPPAKSGIADYSAALLDPLREHAEVVTFQTLPNGFVVSDYDALLYQLGNNPEHEFVYEAALRHPGVIVLHEANLHHLIADMTLKRGDADGYWREVAENGGARTAHPDYRLPLLKSVIEKSKGAIVHSDDVARILRTEGFAGPIARIPHGAWIPETIEPQRSAFRAKLGVADGQHLFGVFGFLKPYKRIREILRAFRRLARQNANVRLILVGETHPELPLDLPPEARHIDFAAIDDFNGYMAACDSVLNLRFPTVGETSGSLMRALGMGKPSVVSDVGAFRELPDDVCLKVPVDSDEDECLFAFMEMLVSRVEIGEALSTRARSWAERECSWLLVARHYFDFLSSYHRNWVPVDSPYVETHRTRFETTLSIIPRGGPNDWILELGTYMQITAALRTRLGYGHVLGSYVGPEKKREKRTLELPDHGTLELQIDHFDVEKDFFPYPNAHFLTVLCGEMLEHLTCDPMHMMEQIHRIVRPGGYLVLTTPNVASMRSVAAILQGFHPMAFHHYMKEPSETRHAREYTPEEVRALLENSGFEVTLLETGPFREELHPEQTWVEKLLGNHMLPRDHRGEGIYAVGRKVGPIRERYPSWLYI